MDENGGDCWPSQKTISEKTGLTERAVRKHIKILVKDGWIIKTTKGYNNKRHRLNEYQANIPVYVSKKVGVKKPPKKPKYRLVDVEDESIYEG
jgi:DNA-binding Lrp family transcriptional regulator